MAKVKHPYFILIENIKSYSNKLNAGDIKQYAKNSFLIDDENFNRLKFFRDVTKKTGVEVKHHEYIGAGCQDTSKCFKVHDVYGFDNVLFYIKNKLD